MNTPLDLLRKLRHNNDLAHSAYRRYQQYAGFETGKKAYARYEHYTDKFNEAYDELEKLLIGLANAN